MGFAINNKTLLDLASLGVFIISIFIIVKLGKAFGKSNGFIVGMVLLPIIFFPILAFSKDTKYIR